MLFRHLAMPVEHKTIMYQGLAGPVVRILAVLVDLPVECNMNEMSFARWFINTFREHCLVLITTN